MQERVQVRLGDVELRLQVKLSRTREWNEDNNSFGLRWACSLRLDAELRPEALNAVWGGSTRAVSISSSSGWPSVEWSQRRRSHVGRGDQPTLWFIPGTKIWFEGWFQHYKFILNAPCSTYFMLSGNKTSWFRAQRMNFEEYLFFLPSLWKGEQLFCSPAARSAVAPGWLPVRYFLQASGNGHQCFSVSSQSWNTDH